MKVVLFANTEWYLFNFRLPLAKALRDAGYEVLLLSPPGPYGERLEAAGFRWIEAPMERRSLNPFRELRLINWLRQLIRDEQIELVHGFTIKCAVYGALAARLAGDRARVCAVAGMGYVFSSQSWRARLLRPLVRLIMKFGMGGRRARLILQNHDDVKAFEKARILPPERIRLIRGSGVNCALFRQHAERRDNEPLRVLLAARLLWSKGVEEFVEAARLLKQRDQSAQFLLAGTPDEGNPDTVPEEVLQQWCDEGLIERLGHVDDMVELLASVHVMALPTTYGEGVPRSLIEAAASGLALVATDTPGCREIVVNEQTGLLFPSRDVTALANSIERFIKDPKLANRLGQAARAKAVSEFDEKIVVGRTIEVYEELLP